MANSPWPSTYWPTAFWQDAYWQGMAAASDTTAPTIDTATVPAGGTRIVINYLEAGSPPVLPTSSDVTGYSVTVNGIARSIVLGRSTGAAQHTLFLDTPVYSTDVVRLMYTAGNVSDSNLVVNNLATIASPGILVTNNSTLSQSSGGSGVIAQLVRGPLSLRANGRISERGYIGDTLPLLCQFEDAQGQLLSVSGVTLTGVLTQNGATVISSISPANTYSDVAMFRMNVSLASVVAGVAKLTVRRDGGSTDIQTSEILIEVLAR